CFFFFFQAEDGIRDSSVTGVQTCALPICTRSPPASRRNAARDRSTSLVLTTPSQPPHPAPRLVTTRTPLLPGRNVADQTPDLGEIGRAACRESSWVAVSTGAVAGGESCRW